MSGCALYRHFDADGRLLYVGISDNPVQRTREHRRSSRWRHRIAQITIEQHDTREAALKAESSAIRAEKPECNGKPGRPLLFGGPAVRCQVYLPLSVALELRELGNGSLSVGIMTAWREIKEDEAARYPWLATQGVPKRRGAMLTPYVASRSMDNGNRSGIIDLQHTEVRSMPTIRELAARYVAEETDHLADRTHHDYLRNIEIINQHWGDRDPETIKPRELGQFMDVKRGRIQRGKIVTVLANIYRLAVAKWWVVENNPTRDLIMPKANKRTRYVTQQEFDSVYSIASPPLQLAMDLAYLIGQRQGDLVNLTWLDIDATPRTEMPDGTVSYGIIHIDQGKTGMRFDINITEAVMLVLLRARKLPPMLPRLYIIRTRHGEPFSSAGFRALWQRTIKKALHRGLIDSIFTFHDLRARSASDNPDIQKASELLGHQNVQMTKAVYDRSVRVVQPLK